MFTLKGDLATPKIVPFEGGGELATQLIAGAVDVAVLNLAEAASHTVGETATIVVEHFRLHADQRQLRRQRASQVGRSQHLLEAGLVHADFLRTHEAGHVVAADQLQRRRHHAEVDGVEDQQSLGAANPWQQEDTLRAAVHDADLVGEHVTLVQQLDAADTETLVGPQDVADAVVQSIRQRRVETLVSARPARPHRHLCQLETNGDNAEFDRRRRSSSLP